ncbi:methyltransferase domain-containing protein [Bacillus sp. DNRA2]|nr:methyltransferase domain-containing protein [Bacillus sp. DNRA2]
MSSALFVKEYAAIFKCPICGSNMNVVELKSLICQNNHTFDFTKQGYLNLMTHQIKTKYDKDLFEARQKLISEVGFFNPLIEAIISIINRHDTSNNLMMLDTGCGEGSHLTSICEGLNKTAIGVGIDIAKEGIIAAAKNHTKQIWTVADLANPPFQAQQFDVILNILSPSNYAEFNRLLKNDGLLIKVVPQSSYLQELRQAFYHETDKETYSNSDTVERFNERFQILDSARLTYSLNLDKASLESLIQMTPLTWSSSEEQIQAFLAKNISDITIDLEILIGKKNLFTT